jgi:hypothetical protein
MFYQYLVNFFYRHPKAIIKKYKRFGGYFNFREIARFSKKMELRSMDLPPVPSDAEGLSVYFLTGQKYFYQTLFCIQSLVKQSNEKFRFILVDDGSFDRKLTDRIEAQLPGAVIVTQSMIDHNLGNMLPEDRFPYLRHKREKYPHIRKLTDIHTLPGSPWKLVLDSDMLFWNEPKAIIKWLKHPDRPLHMVDCAESYGYSTGLMEELCGARIRPLINVGAIGLRSGNINWEKIERCVKVLEEKEGKTYYLEQALSAIIIGDADSVILNAGEYIVNPSRESMGILHHYVDLSKEIYFKNAWQLI